MTNGVIEGIAVDTVKKELRRYSDMFTPYITENDKTPLWDGEIQIYNSTSKGKSTFEGRISVQVKGTAVSKITNGNSKYRMDIVDLKGYQKDKKGTLLFVVEVKSVDEVKLYYANLLPVELNELLNKGKKGKKSVNIDIKPVIDKSPSSIKNVCLNFLENSNQQFGLPIISINEMEEVEEVKFKVICEKENLDEYILNQDIYLYGTTKDNRRFVLPKLQNIYLFRSPKQVVKIGKKVYYNKTTTIKNAEEQYILFGKSTRIFLNKNRFEIKICGNLYERINDCEFILDIINKKYMHINSKRMDVPLQIEDESVKEFISNIKIKLESYKKLKKVLDKMKIKLDIDFSELNEQDFKNLQLLSDMNEGSFSEKIIERKVYYVNINKYKIAFIVIKDKKGKKKLYNYFENLNDIMGMFYINDNGERIRTSIYINLTVEEIISFSNINLDIIRNSFVNIDYSEPSREVINFFMLKVLQAYDKSNNKDLLYLAKDINDKLVKCSDNPIHIINKYQIIVRERNLTKEEKDMLFQIYQQENTIPVKLGIAILLNNKFDVDRYMGELDAKELEELKKYPIMKLI